jgi:hypothetical protein
MTDGINDKILSGIEKNCNGDGIINSFLRDALYEESEHAGKWRWKETYRDMIKNRSEEWGGINED